MRRVLFVSILMLSACTQDNYMLPSGGQVVDQEKYDSNLHDCKYAAIHKYQESRSYAGLMGGVFGGAIGGAVGGLADSQSNRVDINKEIEACMEARGYAGTSSGYN